MMALDHIDPANDADYIPDAEDIEFERLERAAIVAESNEELINLANIPIPERASRRLPASPERLDAMVAAGTWAPVSKPARSFRLWEPVDIWAPLLPPDYLVDGLLVRGSLALLVAYGSSLKTWLALGLALSSSTGSEWLGLDCKQVPSCFIDFESGADELRRRLQRLAKGHDLETPIAGFTFASMPSMNLADESFFIALDPLCKRFGFIAIDSLAAGSGGVDENDARFAGPLNRLKAMASESGCVIALIHHSRKSAGENKNYDDREMVRGSSAIFNACDVVLNLVRADAGLFTVRQSKARGGKAITPFTVRVDDVGEDACRLTVGEAHTEEPKKSPSRSLQAAKDMVLELIGKEHDLKSKNAVFRRTRGNRNTIFNAVDELQEDGLVVVHDGAFRLASEMKP